MTRSFQMSFDLGEIKAVTFRCGGCRTLLSFPRIRWANLPENCPNCGAKWMTRPCPDSLLVEDAATTVFRAIRSFREALQALIGLGNTAGFVVGLEIEKAEWDPTLDTSQRDAVEEEISR